MNRYLASLLFATTLSYGDLINGIAIIINDVPITLYDIDEKMQNNHISKKNAVDILIDETLYNEELKKYNINITIFDINEHIEKLASQNNMNLIEFKKVVETKQNYDVFIQQIRKQLTYQKLVLNISKGRLKVASKDDMELFYNNNKNQFAIADTIDVIFYSSNDERLLNKLKSNPMMIDKNIISQKIILKQNELNSEIKYILNNCNKNEFSDIFKSNNSVNMFYIVDKSDIKLTSFEDSKNMIYNQIMTQRQKEYLKDYFETLKITANIQVLR